MRMRWKSYPSENDRGGKGSHAPIMNSTVEIEVNHPTCLMVCIHFFVAFSLSHPIHLIWIDHSRKMLSSRSLQKVINPRIIRISRTSSMYGRMLVMHFSALSTEEEDKEKTRVATLSKYQKEMELRTLDKEISRLNTLRGINTGELYTFRGKFKALARDYGIGFVLWYWSVWACTGLATYAAIEIGNVDVMALIQKVDIWTGYNISKNVDPTVGAIGLTLFVNELLEPIRLPIVVLTTKPVVEYFSPKNY